MLLYIHIPFCHRICPYCSFYKHTPGGTPIGKFISALGVEANSRRHEMGDIRSIYFGGGTPSMLSPNNLIQLFSSLKNAINFSHVKEITLEANPATFNESKAALIRDLGVTRVSLGIQSFSPHVLRILGREHSPSQADAAVEILQSVGFPSINIDLMFSIPGQSKRDWEDTLRHATNLNPDHISAYNLTYEEDTVFFESLRNGEMRESEDTDAEYFHLAEELLGAAGFDHYETSNYSKPGHHSSHNMGYWRGEDYIGLGPSAVSTVNRIRSRNVPDTVRYISQIRSLGHAKSECEELDDEATRLERIALGLRTKEGISLDLLDVPSRQRARNFVDEKLAVISENQFVLVNNGRALVDPIAAELI